METDDWHGGLSLVECNRMMLHKQVDCDVTFHVGKSSTEIKAHKYILSSRSSVFRAMLFGPLAEKDIITVPDIEPDIFTTILRFLYCDEMDISNDNVCGLMYASHKYGLTLVSNLCSNFLEKSLNVDNVCNILESAVFYSEQDLQAKCLKIVFENAEYVMRSDSLFDLSSNSLELIIMSDFLRADEKMIYEAVICWGERECLRQELAVSDGNIRNVLGKLLYLIRFPIMSGQCFADIVASHSILSMEEKLDIFMYINGSAKIISNKLFLTNPRLSPNKYLYRYKTISQTNWNLGKHDEIKFRVSRDISIKGIVIYGCVKGAHQYEVKATLLHGTNVLTEATDVIRTKHDKKTYDVVFPNSVDLLSNICYTVSVVIQGPPSHCGESGSVYNDLDDVTFTFENSSNSPNGTCVTRGQIPGLIFSVIAHRV